ncbi:MAG: four helix bundle protein [Candidatus Uhrbacteria bacterium]|jgi:four helix bundle protein
MIRDFKDLLVWQKSMSLVKKIYVLLDALPSKEEFGLKAQLRRSSVSIPSNIAEGSKRGTRKDYLHFVRTANGSLAEVETQLLIAKDLYQIETQEILTDLNEVSKMMNGLISSLASSNLE